MVIKSNLEVFDRTNERHMDALSKIAYYDFRKNLSNLTSKLSSNIFFYDESKIYYVDQDGNFYISIVGINKDCNDTEFLIGSHKIYHVYSEYSYMLNEALTKKWQKVMKEAYPNSDYVDILRTELEQERQIEIDRINRKYNHRIQNL